MRISKFDHQIQRAMESVVKSDFEKARMQLNAIELNIKKDMKGKSDLGNLSKIKRVRFIQAGLFNKKFKL